jgi:hypothetical protein
MILGECCVRRLGGIVHSFLELQVGWRYAFSSGRLCSLEGGVRRCDKIGNAGIVRIRHGLRLRRERIHLELRSAHVACGRRALGVMVRKE